MHPTVIPSFLLAIGLAVQPVFCEENSRVQVAKHTPPVHAKGASEATAVCSYITSRMRSEVPQVPTSCTVKSADPPGYELRIFSPTNALEEKTRRAWSGVLFEIAQDLFYGEAMGGVCRFRSKASLGCQLDISDAFLSQNSSRYRIEPLPPDLGGNALRGDPSSDDWYLHWWYLLKSGQESDYPGHRSNAEGLGQEACKNYLRSLGPRFSALNTPLPSCAVMLTTDSDFYAAIELPSLLAYDAALLDPLIESFGRAFSTTPYRGAVIFQTQWSADDHSDANRVYVIYDLLNITLAWDELHSGSRDDAGATAYLMRSQNEGQTRRSSFFDRSSGGAVLRISSPGDRDTLVDITDGSEWAVPNDVAARCLAVGDTEMLLTDEKGGSPILFHVGEKRRDCDLKAVFVKAW